MPKLNDSSMEEYQNIGTFGFSATKINELGSSEYTLVNILVDASGSVSGFAAEMETALKETVRACQLSPRADSLMIRVAKFHDDFEEVHGFKLLEKINLDDYNGVMLCGGSTLLFDSVINAMEATTKYAQSLFQSDFKCNAITVVITDGDDNRSKFGKDAVAKALQTAITSEALESLVSILVGVNVTSSYVANFLADFKRDAGFTQYVELKDASAKTLAKLADFISKSVSSQSQSLGTGGPSKSLTF
jgi:hypothetical protein